MREQRILNAYPSSLEIVANTDSKRYPEYIDRFARRYFTELARYLDAIVVQADGRVVGLFARRACDEFIVAREFG